MPESPAALAPLPDDVDAAVIADWVARMVRIPSVNPLHAGPRSGPGGERDFAMAVAEWCADLGAADVELDEVLDERPNVYAAFPGRTDRLAVLDVHLDTVTVENMTDPPFDGRIEDGCVWGRGALDTKASLGTICALMASWRRRGWRPEPTLLVVGTIGEEAGGLLGAAAFRRWADGRGLRVDQMVVSEPTECRPVHGHKGAVGLRVEVIGESAHSSTPEQGRNAVFAAARAIAALEDLSVELVAGPASTALGTGTLLVSMVNGGVAPNVVPDRCAFVVGRRLVPGEDPQQEFERIEAVVRAACPLPVVVEPLLRGPDGARAAPPSTRSRARPSSRSWPRRRGRIRPRRPSAPMRCDTARSPGRCACSGPAASRPRTRRRSAWHWPTSSEPPAPSAPGCGRAERRCGAGRVRVGAEPRSRLGRDGGHDGTVPRTSPTVSPTASPTRRSRMLSPYRVLDLTDDRGELAGFILAMLGAEVIAVEPPGGSPSRHRGPWAGGEPHPDRSLTHWAYARGKRSIVLDLDGSEADRETLRRLADGADVVIESATPGRMAALGLDHAALSARNPALVYASISPFGQDGPKAQWAATDLTVWASAGPLVLTGDDDRAPVRVGVPQAFLHASAEAAGAIVAALIERSRSGLGQHVDVSAQQASAQATQCMVLAAPNNADMARRGSGAVKVGPLDLQLVWPCKDGHVSITFLFGTALGPPTARFMNWIHEEGVCDEATRDKDWIAYGGLLMSGAEPLEEYARVKRIVGEFCSTRTKAELLQGAMERRLLIAPLSMVDDVVGSPQLASRGYWVEQDGVRWPGAFAKLSMTPLPTLGLPRPLGADTEAVLADLAAGARRPACGAAVTPEPTARPLEGLKVLDLMWVMAGPAGTRVLADLGATVVRVESNKRVDTARTLQPFRNNDTGVDSSMLFASLNAGKLDITIDPTMPEGREVLADLIRWADVLTESFSPRALKGWGLEEATIRSINPSILMLSSCLFGQTGPLSEFAGYGTMAAALSASSP